MGAKAAHLSAFFEPAAHLTQPFAAYGVNVCQTAVYSTHLAVVCAGSQVICTQSASLRHAAWHSGIDAISGVFALTEPV